MGKEIREASTLILIAVNDIANEPPLTALIKRGSVMNYLPDVHVFPGGNFDIADAHIDWLSIIPAEEQNVQLNIENGTAAPIPKSISSRITAIRETFEECGILLCRQYHDVANNSSHVINPLDIIDNQKWRRKVQENACEFLNLCRTHRCYPDIGSLFLVSNWVTPPHLHRRYDCKFFVCMLKHITDGQIDGVEVQSMEWKPISFFINNEDIFLAPAQFHELSRLEKFEDLHSLGKFLVETDREQCERLTSIHVQATDGMIFLLPGDERYNQKSSYAEIDDNVMNLRGMVMRRIEYLPSLHPAKRRNLIVRNYSQMYGPENFISAATASKL